MNLQRAAGWCEAVGDLGELAPELTGRKFCIPVRCMPLSALSG
ncbi:hypothetical protein [Desulfotruncus arcticus]|nr:hypothetical protein [Desulfotruncus arcticus]